ncbi:MAG: DUF4362 domain-containing protein [Lachnospiraceae bacterium]|nr:DUF4362 domain-containing protein [Lachnospiraceae bacterium]
MAACLAVCLGLYWGTAQKPAYESTKGYKALGEIMDVDENGQNMQQADVNTDAVTNTSIIANTTAATTAIRNDETAVEAMEEEQASVECLKAKQEEGTLKENLLQAATGSEPEEKEMGSSNPLADGVAQDITQYNQELNYELSHGKVLEGQEKWQDFLTCVRAGQKAGIWIVQYTDEGDPIYITLEYDTEAFHVKVDNSQDKWTTEPEIREYTFANLNILQDSDHYEAILSAEPDLTTEQLYSGEYDTFSLFQYNIE